MITAASTNLHFTSSLQVQLRDFFFFFRAFRLPMPSIDTSLPIHLQALTFAQQNCRRGNPFNLECPSLLTLPFGHPDLKKRVRRIVARVIGAGSAKAPLPFRTTVG